MHACARWCLIWIIARKSTPSLASQPSNIPTHTAALYVCNHVHDGSHECAPSPETYVHAPSCRSWPNRPTDHTNPSPLIYTHACTIALGQQMARQQPPPPPQSLPPPHFHASVQARRRYGVQSSQGRSTAPSSFLPSHHENIFPTQLLLRACALPETSPADSSESSMSEHERCRPESKTTTTPANNTSGHRLAHLHHQLLASARPPSLPAHAWPRRLNPPAPHNQRTIPPHRSLPAPALDALDPASCLSLAQVSLTPHDLPASLAPAARSTLPHTTTLSSLVSSPTLLISSPHTSPRRPSK